MPTTPTTTAVHRIPRAMTDATLGRDVDDNVNASLDYIDAIIVEWLSGTGDPPAITPQAQGNGRRIYHNRATNVLSFDAVSKWVTIPAIGNTAGKAAAGDSHAFPGPVTVSDDFNTTDEAYMARINVAQYVDIATGNLFGPDGGIWVQQSDGGGSAPIRASAFTATSDERLKTDIKPIADALATVQALRGVEHAWTTGQEGRSFGLIAQEVQEVAPSLVSIIDPEDGILGVDYGRIAPIHNEGIKALHAMLQAQQAQIDTLTARLATTDTVTKSKVSLSEKIIGLVATLIVAGSIGTIVLAVGFTGRANLAEAQRLACRAGIADRLGTIRARQVQATSARSIAQDPLFQSRRTRDVRLAEAQALQTSVRDLRTRVDPAHGGRLVCAEAFPNPSVF
jgi:hypothetical protein